MFNKCANSLLKLNLRIYDSLIRWKSVSTTVPSPKGEFTAKWTPRENFYTCHFLCRRRIANSP